MNGWLDKNAYTRLSMDAMEAETARLELDMAASDVRAAGAYDAGFEAGVEAQKHGLGEA